MAGASLFLIAVAALASLFPALRVTRVDPIRALPPGVTGAERVVVFSLADFTEASGIGGRTPSPPKQETVKLYRFLYVKSITYGQKR